MNILELFIMLNFKLNLILIFNYIYKIRNSSNKKYKIYVIFL